MKVPFRLCFTLFLFTYVSAKDVSFPSDFSFGAATAAYQVEGAWNVDGKSLSIWDNYTHRNPSPIADKSTGDVACDSYHRYKEDIALAAATGSNVYRFSIAWTRILPTGYADNVNQKGIEYYRNVIQEIINHNMTPIATIYHWDLPQALFEAGLDWTNEDLIPIFVNYSRVVIESFPNVGHWITINEPKLICHWGYGTGKHAPGIKGSGIQEYQCGYVVLKSHAAVYHMYKEEFSHYTAPMYIVIDFQWVEPLTNSIEDIEAAERQIEFDVGMYLHPIFIGDWPEVVKNRINHRSEVEGLGGSRLPYLSDDDIDFLYGTTDYIGLNHYYTKYGANAPEGPTNQTSFENDVRVANSNDPSWEIEVNGWAAVPWGLRKVLNWLNSHYNRPQIIITENGYADHGDIDDTKRVDFYNNYFCQVLAAMEDGVDVKGIITWCLMDLFGWHNGYITHFGLYYIDHNDANLTRIPKTSASFWKNMTSTNKLTCDDSLFSFEPVQLD